MKASARMADDTLTLTITRKDDGTLDAMIECPSFVADSDGEDFIDPSDVFHWADHRTRNLDPFTYED